MEQKLSMSYSKKVVSIELFLSKINRFYFILTGALLMLLINILITSLPASESISNIDGINSIKKSGALKAFFLVIIFSPIVETALFQLIPLRLIPFIFKKIPKLYLILISAIAFAAIHSYNATYIVFTFFGGLVLAYFFLLSIKRKEYAFINITIIHMLLNSIPYTRDFILIHF